MKTIVNNMDKKKHYAYVPYIFVNIGGALIIAFTYLISKHPHTVGGLGGSFMLFPIIVVAICSFYFIRSLSLELSFIPLVIAGVMGINFLSYLEMTGGTLNVTYSWIVIGCIFWTLYWFLYTLFVLIKPSESLNEQNKRLKVQLTITLAPVFFISIPFIVITHVTFLKLQKYSPQMITDMANNPFFKYTTISTGLLILALFVSLVYLLKIRDEDLKKLVIEEKYGVIKYETRKIKKYFLLISSVVISIGSIIETQRGMWVMWIETILLIGTMSMIIWKIYKHVFDRERAKEKR